MTDRPRCPRLRGLYAITDARETDPGAIAHAVEQTLHGGAAIIQLRDKSCDHPRRLRTAQALRELTHQHHALLIINDDVALAATCNADGVHIGQHDTELRTARSQLGPRAIIGVSCYNRFELAQQAAASGADYVAFGRFFPSKTKPDAVAASFDLIRRAKQELDIPVVAIGGISAQNAAPLLDAGADMLAVINNLFGQTDIRTAAQQYQTLMAFIET
ncbi:MAG TPA: thiamine phosphate synthase [Gammaproteobacteria bacterium]|nr:thiamine phosphate synthase [Gammaproteobacteria bacterium]